VPHTRLVGRGGERGGIRSSRACGLVWNCTDIVGGLVFDRLRDELEAAGQMIKSRTFGACARAILEDITPNRLLTEKWV
jgi:hypothetical protein